MSEAQRYPDVLQRLATIGKLEFTAEHFELLCKALLIYIEKEELRDNTIEYLEQELAAQREKETYIMSQLAAYHNFPSIN